MKNIVKPLLLAVLTAAFFMGCSNEDMKPLYEEQIAGKVIIRGYSALKDSLQLIADGKPLEVNGNDSFVGKIKKDYAFVYYNNRLENINIVNKATGETIRSYNFTANKSNDTLSFFIKEGIYIDDVLSFSPGILSATSNTGYKFIFPTLNRYSASGYNGPIDGIIKKTNGQVIGIAENITKDNFSSFVEFVFTPPPIFTIELVKHGTTESYISGQKIIVQMAMQNNKSRMIVLDEKTNESGAFSGVDGSANLVDYFDF
ncbi:hypothetical protein ACX0HA_17520 [Flavobacterium hauense]